MQFPESWLREFCDPPLSQRRAGRAADHGGARGRGAASRSRRRFTESWWARSRGRAASQRRPAARVPGRRRRRRALLTIVCGAPNVRAGIKVPCALVGARAAAGGDGKPFEIKLGKLRGVESQGMLCSARELKLSDDHGGLLVLDRRRGAGSPTCASILQLDDTLFTLKLTPNLARLPERLRRRARGGGARPARRCDARRSTPVPATIDDRLPVTIEAPDLCGRFSGRVVRGVERAAPRRRRGWSSASSAAASGDHGAGRHLELRDVRTRPALAHLRPGQDRRRPRRCAGAAPASSSSC